MPKPHAAPLLAGHARRSARCRLPSRRLSVILLTLCGLAAPARAQTELLGGFADVEVASGLQEPMAMTFAPDGRLFVCEQAGRLRVIENDMLLPAALLDLTGVVDDTIEKGLLAVAFDPDFETNQHFYVYYTALTPNVHNRVSRFTADGNGVVPGSEVVLLDFEAVSVQHHGTMMMGPDDRLWIGTGDNGNPTDAQSLDNPHGKMLRIATDGSIPLSNPYYFQTTGINRAIWARGLRNPFSFAFHPDSGRLFINDVGELSWEEIDDGLIGANYGWPLTEGPTSVPSYSAPVFAYPHQGASVSGRCIVGSVFFAPEVTDYPESYRDLYVFADYTNKWIKTLDVEDDYSVADFVSGSGPFRPIDLDVGPDGNLYYLTRLGRVHRIEYDDTHPPVVTRHSKGVFVAAGQPAVFAVSAFGDSLRFQWERNGVTIPGATGMSLALSAVAETDAGSYRCVVSNGFGSVASDPARLVVTAFNLPPEADIVTPAPATSYAGGQTFAFSGSARDVEDGLLPDSALSWRLDFHHDGHVRDSPPFAVGVRAGTFTIPALGETATDVWYRLTLTVTDSAGLSDTTFVDLHPSVIDLTLTTDPPGLPVYLDGRPTPTPAVVESVVGVQRTLGAGPAPARMAFQGWTGDISGIGDPQANSTILSTPATSATIRAGYALSPGSVPPAPDAAAPTGSVPPFAVLSVHPASGAHGGGTTVLIRGVNLEDVTAVYFGSRPAVHVAVLDGTRVLATTPPSATHDRSADVPAERGRVPVTLVGPGGSTTLRAGFVYVPADDPP